MLSTLQVLSWQENERLKQEVLSLKAFHISYRKHLTLAFPLSAAFLMVPGRRSMREKNSVWKCRPHWLRKVL